MKSTARFHSLLLFVIAISVCKMSGITFPSWLLYGFLAVSVLLALLFSAVLLITWLKQQSGERTEAGHQTDAASPEAAPDRPVEQKYLPAWLALPIMGGIAYVIYLMVITPTAG